MRAGVARDIVVVLDRVDDRLGEVPAPGDHAAELHVQSIDEDLPGLRGQHRELDLEILETDEHGDRAEIVEQAGDECLVLTDTPAFGELEAHPPGEQ